MSIGLGAAGSIGSAVQAQQISSISNKVDEKASQTDLTSAKASIAALQTCQGTLLAGVGPNINTIVGIQKALY